jgi:DNA-binding CsgD family transcriptional regulator
MDRSSLAALPAIYDAALSDEHWPRALQLFSEEIHAVGAILVAIDQVGLPFHIETASYPMDQVRHYFANYGHYDQRTLGDTLPAAPPLKLQRDREIWGDIEALRDRPDYVWMRENIGACRKGGVRLSTGKGWTDMLALQFDRDWEELPKGLEAYLQTLVPHLAKVVEINRQFSILRARYHAALAALDHVRIGTCVLSPSGHVVVANREARRIHDLDDGLQFSRGGTLVCGTSDQTTQLSQKIHAVVSTAAGEGSDTEHLMFIERPSGKRPLMIEIAPIRDSLGELEAGLRGALVYIVDLENQKAVSIRRLSVLYALTEAEADICRQMVGGQSAAEIAKARDVTEETVRTQFKAVYAKTGVRRRADLVRLALTVDPPIGLEDA